VSVDQNLSAFIWSVADLLRGDYKQSEYGKVILPFTVLRRFDCVMAPTRQAVWDRDASYPGDTPPALLKAAAGLPFYNTSKQDFGTIGADPANVRRNLTDYVNGFSAEVADIIDRYAFHTQVERLDASGLLYQVVQKFADPKLDLSLERVSNHDMGYLFEELIRKFSELSNETAGEHFTPREVIELMVELLLGPDKDALTGEGKVIDILDPACGTGGMLAAAEEHIRRMNEHARINLAGQELNAESYAICRSDMLMKGYDERNSSIAFGNSFSSDGHKGRTFRYMLANPPFGVEWKKVEQVVKAEHKDEGHAGRFGAGLPRINDGSFLFLQHMMSKMRPVTADVDDELKGSRIAIVFNGSPLFTGGAGSGESEIRRWIIENDYLEAIVALPDQLFYNTGISTYFWIVTNNKAPRNKGKVILLDARDQWTKIRKSSARSARRSARSSGTTSAGSTATPSTSPPTRTTPTTPRSRCSATRTSATSASPSTGPSASASRSARRPSPPSPRPRPCSSTSCETSCWAASRPSSAPPNGAGRGSARSSWRLTSRTRSPSPRTRSRRPS